MGVAMGALSWHLIGPAGSPGFKSEPLNVGWSTHYWYLGALRPIFAFPLGIAMARLLPQRVSESSRWAILPLAGLVAVFLPTLDGTLRLAYILTCIFLVFPALLAFASRIEPMGWVASIAGFLGSISYPLYAVHSTLNQAFGYYLERRLGLSHSATLPIYLMTSMVMAWLITRFLDPAIRKRMQLMWPAKARKAVTSPALLFPPASPAG